MLKFYKIWLISVTLFSSIFSNTISGTVIDSVTQKPIPAASIVVGMADSKLIEQGEEFQIILERRKEKVIFFATGYEPYTVKVKASDSSITIKMSPDVTRGAKNALLVGTITDETGEILTGATIFTKNDTVKSDENGFFNISIKDGTSEIGFLYEGYNSVTKSISLDPNSISSVDIALSLTKEMLEKRGKVNGVVRDSRGFPIEGATVSFINSNYATQTNRYGEYSIEGIPS